MRLRPYVACLAASFLVAPTALPAQAARATSSGSISGTVTTDGQAAAGVKVVALEGGVFQRKVASAAVTDSDGRYYLKGLPAGHYSVTIDAPTSTLASHEEDDHPETDKFVSLGEGENVDGVDLQIAAGAVISGRILEDNGKPVIGEFVQIIPFNEKDRRFNTLLFDDANKKFRAKTDDRGIYRAFGVPAGKYAVFVGSLTGERPKPQYGSLPIPKTYYPSFANPEKAQVVEVAAGTERTAIDITVSRHFVDKGGLYSVEGRIVDAETGKPLAGVSYSCRTETSDEEYRSSDRRPYVHEFGESDPSGRFRIQGLPVGGYKIQARTGDESGWYSDELPVDVSGDLGDIEIRANRAGSISGTVVVDGTTDPSVPIDFSQIRIGEGPTASGRAAPVNSDGTFRLPNLGPGSHMMGVNGYNSVPEPTLLRVEYNDEQDRFLRIKVGPGEDISGVRLVIARYNANVTGQITIVGGALPSGASLCVSATPVNAVQRDHSYIKSKAFALTLSRQNQGSVDSRGHYAIEHLAPGEYQLALDVYLSLSRANDDALPLTVTKSITIANGDHLQIDLEVNLSQNNNRQ